MAGLVTRLAAKVADTWKEQEKKGDQMEKQEGQRYQFLSPTLFSHQAICCAPLMLLRNVCHISKDHREGDGEDARHGDDCKIPPKSRRTDAQVRSNKSVCKKNILTFAAVIFLSSDKMSELCSYHGLIFISGMGAHVKKTVSSKKDLRPQTSDNAPIRGALKNDNRPWKRTRTQRLRRVDQTKEE